MHCTAEVNNLLSHNLSYIYSYMCVYVAEHIKTLWYKKNNRSTVGIFYKQHGYLHNLRQAVYVVYRILA